MSGGGVGPRRRNPPRPPPGFRPRAKLIAAARAVFERDGFLDARLVDIAAEANMAVGSFYTYFDSKEEIFASVHAEVEREMLNSEVAVEESSGDPISVIRASNRAYLDSYRRNAEFMRLLNQVASINDEFRELWRQRSESFTRRNAHSIAELQKAGVADPGVDAHLAAFFLSGMVSRAAFARFVQGEDWEFEEMVETLTTLWANALNIRGRRRSDG